MRRILLAAAAASLVLAGCSGGGGSGGSANLASVKVSNGATPTVSVKKGFTASKTETRVLKEGTGQKIAAADSVRVNYVGINARTGKEFDSSYKSGGKQLTVAIDETKFFAGFIKGLSGQKVGSRLLVAIPPVDGFGDAGQPAYDVKKDDTMVFLFDVMAIVPAEATGAAEVLPSNVPQIKLDASGHPSGFTATADTKAKPTKESADVVIQGTGPALEAGQVLTAQYVGQVYPDGAVFDESWSSGARSFQVGTGSLIKCWDDLLVGQKLGSRVVLVCPADTAYGDTPQSPDIKPGDTLTFVIDLLDAYAAS